MRSKLALEAMGITLFFLFVAPYIRDGLFTVMSRTPDSEYLNLGIDLVLTAIVAGLVILLNDRYLNTK